MSRDPQQHMLLMRLASPQAASTTAHDAQSAPGTGPLVPGAPSSARPTIIHGQNAPDAEHPSVGSPVFEAPA